MLNRVCIHKRDILPSGASYVLSIVRILENIDHVIMAPHSICHDEPVECPKPVCCDVLINKWMTHPIAKIETAWDKTVEKFGKCKPCY